MFLKIRLFTFLTLFACLSLSAGVEYQSIEIGIPKGYSQVLPTDINNKGAVIGVALSDDEQIMSFIWDETKRMRKIKNPTKDYVNFIPAAINDHGDVVGVAYKNDETMSAFLWNENKGYTELPYHGPYINPKGINNRGEVVGTLFYEMTIDEETFHLPSAFIYKDHEFIILAKEFDDLLVISSGEGINENGNISGSYIALEELDNQVSENFIVGFLQDLSFENRVIGRKLFTWQEGTVVSLEEKLEGIENITSKAINIHNDLAGAFINTNASNISSFFLNPESNVINIGFPDYYKGSEEIFCQANSINDKGVIVGTAIDTSQTFPPLAFIWDSNKGMRDLNSLFAKGYKWSFIFHAQKINQKGQIIGNGLKTDKSMGAILLTPK